MATVFKEYKEESLGNWGASIDQSQQIGFEQIKLGAILRIADSLENIEKPFKKLLDDADRYERYYRNEVAANKKLSKRIAAYQGIINRMKKQK
jgi:hypothetical protein